jgi:hypothetical protein
MNIGSRRELFVDRVLVETLDGIDFKLHTPQPAPPPVNTIRGHYMTVFQDGPLFRAYYRQYDPSYTGEKKDGCQGEITCYAESASGIEWSYPDLGLFEVNGSRHNNTVLRLPPYSHNFSPFKDANPAAPATARYKALAGTHAKGGIPGGGLHAFQSPDAIHWDLMQAGAVLDYGDFAFDSQNVPFWSEAEGCYVCYFRTWKCSQGKLRAIHRSTSPDFIRWSEPVALDANMPGEHLYTSQTHPYFRAPHIYVALPTRYQPARGSSTDILFMASRAGSTRFERLFPEAFIRPGGDPTRWGNRSNYAACGVLPTGPAEISIYHAPGGQRYTLRTDGFISLHGGYAGGTVTTKPFTFAGAELTLNVATSAGGSVKVELQDAEGRPLPGYSLAEADEIVGDSIDRIATWKGSPSVAPLAGRPVRLHAVMREADMYSVRFRLQGELNLC